MAQEYKLMEIQADVLFKYDSSGRMTEINEPEGLVAPLFFLGRTREGNVIRFNTMFPNSKMDENSRHLSPSNLEVGVSRVSPSRDA
ncbi:hypothetical protein [Bacillus sp. S14(2024)]|uniref:hypothetical protein n=1 Tax=Bacillus sp. S14(2024) TaxID=3162884 RepID=UPI003D21C4CA